MKQFVDFLTRFFLFERAKLLRGINFSFRQRFQDSFILNIQDRNLFLSFIRRFERYENSSLFVLFFPFRCNLATLFIFPLYVACSVFVAILHTLRATGVSFMRCRNSIFRTVESEFDLKQIRYFHRHFSPLNLSSSVVFPTSSRLLFVSNDFRCIAISVFFSRPLRSESPSSRQFPH